VAANSPYLAHHFDNLAQQHEADKLGMWAFLATEVLIFGAMFTAYAAYRSIYTPAFEDASGRLNVLIGGINTVVLLASSLTMALAVYAVHIGRQRELVRYLVLTALLGSLFMVFKAIEYYGDYRDNLVPGLAFDPTEWTQYPGEARQVQLFLAFYYILTGLHAIHLVIGIGLVGWLAVMAHQGAFPPDNYAKVEVIGLYWHFVDVVWIFLLPLLYLIGTHQLSELHLL
jgi:cytochrome c oxidase subunit 3